MEQETAIDPQAGQYQEIVFSVVMTAVGVMSRDSRLVVYPGILWAFEAMLAFNLAHALLSRLRPGPELAVFSVAANAVLISLAMHFSGGFESHFWPLYLLPVFIACLRLGPGYVAFSVAVPGAFLTLFYLEGLWAGAPWQAWELLIKLGVLIASAIVTSRLSFRERAERAALAVTRRRLEALARSLGEKTVLASRMAKQDGLRESIPRFVHDLNNPLMVILGTIELLLKDAPAESVRRHDLLRMQRAARTGVSVAEELLRNAKPAAERVA